jgi:hypothetical protein
MGFRNIDRSFLFGVFVVDVFGNVHGNAFDELLLSMFPDERADFHEDFRSVEDMFRKWSSCMPSFPSASGTFCIGGMDWAISYNPTESIAFLA